MVEIIGLVTITALVRVLAWSMAGESDAERRRCAMIRDNAQSGHVTDSVVRKKRAA
ncbi:hypothetical protein [Petrachloros mirabilis]